MIGSLLLATALSASPHFAFAFSDASGNRLLALGSVADPARLTRATCDGTVREVAFLAQRGGTDSGRQTSANFDQVAGALYQVKGAAIAAGASCLLATAAFFEARPPVAVAATRRPCDGRVAAAVAGLSERAVERCLEVGSLPGGRLALVTYARSGAELLVGFVLVTDAVTAMRSFPATARSGAPSCWRVDDGCIFEPGAYHVPFVLAGAGGPTLFALWDGAEGQNLEILEPKAGVLEAGATAYRYWAPL